jgi:uncharacterized protein
VQVLLNSFDTAEKGNPMSLSREKINHLSQLVVKELDQLPEVTLYEPPNAVRLEIVRAMNDALKLEETIENVVRQKLNSYSRPIPEGSREWDVMYQKFYDEEFDKRLV